jgi:hypothetical protein
MMDSSVPHPASVGNTDHCALCGRYIPDNEHSVLTDRGYRVCCDHLKPSAQQRENLRVVARAKAHGARIQVIPGSPLEAQIYNDALATARRTAARQSGTNGAKAPRRTNGSSGRPGQRHAARSTSSGDSGEDGLADPPPFAPRPRARGPEQLFRDLVRAGLSPTARPAAAALVIRLDEDAIEFPSLEEARHEHLEAKARRWS